MNFTKGKKYSAFRSIEPPGWDIEDNKGHTETFFNIKILFKIDA